MQEMKYTIEIATTDYTTTKAAVAGGADRIELCTALSEGGLTPSFGLIQQCRNDFNVALFPILRPRAGDFLYTPAEFEVIKRDAMLCKQTGCDGVVIGFLNKDGRINKQWTAAIVELVYPLEVTFHRAFDRCRNAMEGLEDIIEAGCQRILTSGQKPVAMEGADLIQQLVQAAADRIVIMPGSGVRAANIKALAQLTGAEEFHSSLKTKGTSNMEYIHPAFAASEESYHYSAVKETDVIALRNALQA
jgi:copper homeostasis protein